MKKTTRNTELKSIADGTHESWISPEDIYKFSQLKGVILDVGCGYGNNFRYFKKRKTTTDIFGIDISKDVLIDKNIIQGDAQDIPFGSNSFDGVICSEVLEHLPKPELCVREISRVLKPQGQVFFATPVLNLPFPGIVPIYRKIARCNLKEGEHIHVFSTRKLVHMINKELNVIDIKHVGFTSLFLSRYGIRFQGLDNFLSSLSKQITLFNFFASTVFVKAIKK